MGLPFLGGYAGLLARGSHRGFEFHRTFWSRQSSSRQCQQHGAEVVVIKVDIVNKVISRTGVSKAKAEMAVETIFEAMKRALERGERIELRGFGVFTVRPRKTGIGRNPRTGEEVSIPPGKAVRFKPGKELQNLT